MDYEGHICRAPMERSSFMLPIMAGCSYNACKFCTLFKHIKYRELPEAQIKAEVIRVKEFGGQPKRIFLGDGNAFGTNVDRLMRIIDMIHTYFPDCNQINMDATVTNIKAKTEGELRRLYNAGVRHLYIGIESGLDDVLSFMMKDHNSAEAYEQILRLANAGIIYDAHIMTGVAGKGRGVENAEKIAAFFNRTMPARIINFSMFIHKSAPLYREIQNGSFTPADELENLVEEQRLLEFLNVEGLKYDGFHDYIEFRVKGTIPNQKAEMRKKLKAKIQECKKDTGRMIAIV